MSKQATLYRMKTPDHICPFGLKSRYLLKKNGYEIDDNLLTSREETDQFMAEQGVDTTPQTFIDGKRIGGYDDLREFFGLDDSEEEEDDTSYQPVIAIFSVTFLMALALTFDVFGSLAIETLVIWFVAISMCALAIQKLKDLEAFTNQFLGYDLLAMKYVPYAKVYAFAEAYAGIGMLSGINPWFFAPVALIIGTIGAISVFKAVYIDKRELKCACVGGNSSVPLGFVSLTENLMMVSVAAYMLAKFLV
ncbi:MAG: MauE/DoxX family redox-associated membrane protein [Marinicella pacifica]